MISKTLFLWVGALVGGVMYIQPDLVNSIQRDFNTVSRVYWYIITLGGIGQ